MSSGLREYTETVYISDSEKYPQVRVKNTGEVELRGYELGVSIGRKRQARVNLVDHPVTLIFTRQTIEQGGIGFANAEVNGAIVTENMPTIAVDVTVFSPEFLVAFFKTSTFRKDVILPNIYGGTAQVAIHEDKVLASSTVTPSLREQFAIGGLIEKMSLQITLHQRQDRRVR